MVKLDRAPVASVTPEHKQQRDNLPAPPHEHALSVEGPSTNRGATRQALLDLFNLRSRQRDHTLPAHPERSTLPDASTAPTCHTAESEVQQKADLANKTEATKPGFFASLKERFLRMTGFNQSTDDAHQEPESERKGFFADAKEHITKLFSIRSFKDFGNFATALASAVLFPLRTERVITPGKKADAAERTLDSHYHNSQQGNTFHAAGASSVQIEHERHFWESNTKPVDLTVQALNTVADAKREENAKEEKSKLAERETERRMKLEVRSILERFNLEGASKAELAAILRELEGVYGATEVAQRQVRDLLVQRSKYHN